MWQEGLRNLAILSIEHSIPWPGNLNFDVVLNTFAEQKIRKKISIITIFTKNKIVISI